MDRREDPESPVTRDPGLARERTELAWNRSGLAVLVAVAVLLRHLWPLDGARSVVAAVLIGGGTVAWTVGMWSARRRDPALGDTGMLGEGGCRMITAGTLVLAGAGFLLGLLA